MNKNVRSAFIRKRNDNYNIYIEFINTEGKIKQKSIAKYKSKKDADKHLIDLKSAINNNKYLLPASITFVDRCNQYYKEDAKKLSPTTMKRYRDVINNYVKVYFKDTKLSDINVGLYQKFVNHLYTTNLMVSTIKEILNKTNAVLRECYKLREVSENIPDFITKPKRNDVSSFDIYTVEDAKKILTESSNVSKLEIPIHLFLLAGLRFGEMAGLLWEDIDFNNNILKINHNLIYVDKKYSLRQTKTDGSTRDIIVPDLIIELLRKEKIRQNKLKNQGLLKNEWDVVCINSKNKYWNNSSFTDAYKKFLKSSDLRYIKLHSLRHSHASMLILTGTDMKTVSERLGHTDIKVTMNIYTHVLKEMDKTASDNIEKLLL
ncbi:MAG: site-specific integrase [Romboutsia sp.]